MNGRTRIGSYTSSCLILLSAATVPWVVACDSGDGNDGAVATWPDPAFVPDTTGFSREGLDALHAANEAQVDDGPVGGIATLLFHDGRVIDHHEYGVADSESGAPINVDTIYRIYSMTKPITSAAMMILIEDGEVSLEDPITKYLPEFANLKVQGGGDVERPATVRELMSHTAGFSYGDTRAPADLDAFIEATAEAPLLFQPGQRWSYSAAVDIQGAIIERASGKRFGEFLQDELFDPLGMKDTHFVLHREDVDRLAEGWATDPDTGEVVPDSSFEADPGLLGDVPRMESGGGGLVSTLPDYARFCEMMVNGGELDGVRYLETETIELMGTDVLTSDGQVFFRPGVGFGLGVAVVTAAEGSEDSAPIGTYSWGGAAGTWFWIDPVNELFFIGMVQNMALGLNPYTNISGRLVYEALE